MDKLLSDELEKVKLCFKDYPYLRWAECFRTTIKKSVPIRIALRRIIKGTQPVLFEPDVIKFLVKVRSALLSKVGRIRGSDTDQPVPLSFMFGQKGDNICSAKLLKTNGGCGNMGSISTEEINKAMFRLTKEGCFTAGIGRVGAFRNIYHYQRGNSLSDLTRILGEQGIFMLSLGLTTFCIEFPNYSKQFIPNSYRILKKGGKTNGTNKRNVSKTGVATHSKKSTVGNHVRSVPKKSAYKLLKVCKGKR